MDQLVCDGKTMRGSIEPISSGGSAFIAHVILYASELGVAISQACYATSEYHERAVPPVAGTFVAMNDATAGYQAQTDAIILLRNYIISSNNYVDFV